MAFTPSRLVLARKRRAWTKKVLSEESGLSNKILWAYEVGAKEPSASTLEHLAEVLEFPVGFFSLPDADELPVPGASFRALTRTTATKRDQALSAGQLALQLSDWIQARFVLPEVTIPRYAGIDPETAAEAIRAEWGLGETPVRNMIHVLEAHGVRVFSLFEENRDIDAFSVWRLGVPYVFLNTMKSAEHSRMDAAHELGHLVMHTAHRAPRGRDEEQQAQLFGAAFLMPRGSVVGWAPRTARIGDLIKAKRQWNVALVNLVYRMHQLALLTDWQYRSLFVEIGSRGFRTEEPDPAAHEASQVLAKVFQSLRDEGVSRSDVARQLEIPVEELNKMVFGLVLTGIAGSRRKGGDVSAVGAKLRVVN